MDELEEMVGQLFNAPSVVLWVPFNEGWGQFDSTLVMEAPALWTYPPRGPRQRLAAIGERGRTAQPACVFQALPLPARPRGRALALSEFGGYNLRVDGHCFNQKDYGYRRLPDAAALWRDFFPPL